MDISPQGIVSGIIPVLKLGSVPTSTFSKSFFDTLSNQVVGPQSGPFGQLGSTLLSNLGQSSLSWAVNQTLGATVAKDLGFSAGESNFLGAIDAPNLLQTGVSSLFTVAEDSIRNSKALGPFGPLASEIVKSYRGAVGEGLSNLIFGAPEAGVGENLIESNGTNYFPGADGVGESLASYGGAAYNASNGTGDVVFSIRYASTAAQDDLYANFGKYVASSFDPNAPIYQVSIGPENYTLDNAETNTQQGQGAKTNAVNSVASDTSSRSNSANSDNSSNTPEFFSKVADNPNFYKGSLPSYTFPFEEDVLGDPSFTDAFNTPQSVFEPVGESAVKAAWKFICPPEDISWETTAQVDRVPIYGANQAPVNAGVKGMRELSLNGAVVEGFTRGKTVEDKIIALEQLMEMSLSGDKKYITVPVYRVAAQDKTYGKGISDGGFFVIKSVKVQEKLRDFSGKTTRALVDISLTQVPSYQVSNGRDLASKILASKQGPFKGIQESVERQTRSLGAQSNQNVPSDQGAPGAQDSKQPPAVRPSGGTPIPGLQQLR